MPERGVGAMTDVSSDVREFARAGKQIEHARASDASSEAIEDGLADQIRRGANVELRTPNMAL